VRYPPVNDDGDPSTIDPAGFQWTELDNTVTKVVLPMKQRLEAAGELLFVNLCYVSFLGSATSFHATDADEYAEFVLATVQHLDTTFGLVPDTWEVILEPDNVSVWTGTRIGNAIARSAARLSAAGYGSIRFVAPSNTNMSRAVTDFDALIQVPGVAGVLRELAYHRYGGVSTQALQAIASRGATYGIDTAMLEHIDSGVDDLHADLTTGMGSAWQQFTIGYPGSSDSGGAYFRIENATTPSPTVVMNNRTKLLRQYFRFVRRGAVRFEASSALGSLQPIAFNNQGGKVAVVVKASGSASFSVGPLPAGTYGINYATASAFDQDHPDQTVPAGGRVSTSIPAAGVLTVYRR
jgi:hypothetical protein